MLAALAQLRGRIEPLFLSPREGRLAEEVRRAGFTCRGFDVRDAAGRRRESDVLVEELELLAATCGVRLVHANSLAMGRLTGRLAQRRGAAGKIVCTAHVRDIVGLSRRAVDDLNANDRLFAVSRATRDWHVAQGLNGETTSVLYNGVDLDLFHPADDAAERAALRRALGLPVEADLAAVIGQIGLRKGLDVLTAAAPLLVHRCPRLHLVIVGERVSGKPESAALELQVRAGFDAAGMAGRVHWLGYRDDVPALLRAVDLLIHPARQEPLGRVLLEAAASALPIVATDVGGTPEILSDGASALLTPMGDAARLATAVGAVLDDCSLARRLGAAARREMLQRFAIDARAAELGDAWEQALE
jgi:glycosyltransferase involved in cell wall biosynthesis